MYAIVETGGKQYRVKPGDTLAVEKLSGEPGEILDLDRVLLIAGNGDSETRVGSPGVAGAVVRAEVLAHFRGEKIIIFRYKSKVRYRRKTGHRQSLTRLRITDILLDGESSLPAAEPEPAAPAAPPAAIDTAVQTTSEPQQATAAPREPAEDTAADEDSPEAAVDGDAAASDENTQAKETHA
jgi:large subunit ribosomal protein L21